MDFDEIISEFNNRSINEKTNNLIIVGNYSKQILDCIPSKCSIIKSDNIEIQALNIKIDLEKVNIKNILSYILNRINNYLDIEFNSKFDLISFDRELRKNNIYCQLIFYNIDSLSIEEQMLFNELYFYYSNNFNVTSFVKENFKTYFLKNGNVLDDRENYQKYILSSEIKVSNEPRVDGCRAFSKTKKIR